MRSKTAASLLLVSLFSAFPVAVYASEDRDSMELLINVYDSSARTTLVLAGVEIPLTMILVGILLMLLPTLGRDVLSSTRR